jgi:hypothetical protein
MSLLNSLASWLIKKRIHDIELFLKYPNEVQKEVLKKLIRQASHTHWGKLYGYSNIDNYETFRNRVPLQDYESLKQFIERQRSGEPNIIWPTDIKWFAKSSGTTSDKSKFIPVSTESLQDCHYKGGKDMLSIYCNNYPETNLFTGKSLSLSGSRQLDNLENDIYSGDVSAIILSNLPLLAEFARTPSMETALMTDWELKIEKIAEETIREDVTSIAGVPSWMCILLEHIQKKTGKNNIHEVWPNLEVYFHGGISIHPYKEKFKAFLPQDNFNFMETYNASEGFFGIQDLKGDDSMLLMLDYGIFYEFIDFEKGNKQDAIQLCDVEIGTVYSMVISTNAGLWRYQIGDTIVFTSTSPYRFKIAGRTKNYINSFGEELMVHNSDKAIEITCKSTDSLVAEYTAGPLFYDDNKGCHEWIIEFNKAPKNIENFAVELDMTLKKLNSDYEAKRSKDILLQLPKITVVPNATFYHWLKTKNKLGGQYKVPRLSNNRQIIDEIYKIL